MKNIIVISKILSECRSVLNEDDINVTLSEALVLEAISELELTKSEISKILSKDKSYIYRTVESLEKKGYVVSEGKLYSLTKKGLEVYRKSSEICVQVAAEIRSA